MCPRDRKWAQYAIVPHPISPNLTVCADPAGL
jgi:hypothetical protein